jgi:hypothetical protein
MSIRIVECGCCGCYHRAEYFGDCRNDDERFPAEEVAAERLNVKTLEVERFEYDRHGDVSEHYVETWPHFNNGQDLPIEN